MTFTALLMAISSGTVAGAGFAEALGRWFGDAPGIPKWCRAFPGGGRPVLVGIVDLLDRGRVLDRERVRIEIVREHVCAGTVPPHTPLQRVAVPLEPARTAHDRIDGVDFVGDVVEADIIAA